MLAEFFIKRWQLTVVMFILLAVMGINALMNITRAVDPHFPIPVVNIIAVLPGALLTALIVVQVFSDGDRLVLDERLAGLVAAGLVLWRRRGAVITAMIAAAAVAAALRALG